MRVELVRHEGKDLGFCRITREDGDKKVPTQTGWDPQGRSDPNSQFLHRVKQVLNTQGHDVIKKRMWKDGNMVDEIQQYVRSRDVKKSDSFCIFDDLWQIRAAVDVYNEVGTVKLVTYFNLSRPFLK